nr:MAG TPA: hypothetical protein [Caudoviricetes sp.]
MHTKIGISPIFHKILKVNYCKLISKVFGRVKKKFTWVEKTEFFIAKFCNDFLQ